MVVTRHVPRLLAEGNSANVVYGDLTVKSTRSDVVLKQLASLEEPVNGSKPDERSTLIERVLGSTQFKASLRLREFLRYVAECAVKECPEAATEQQIGVHVFNRLPGYNSSEDSIVRTHARLLRHKLAEYFSTEGSAEPIVIEVPKGHYLPVFRPRHAEPLPAPVQLVPAKPALPVSAGSFWKTMPLGIALGILCVVVLAGCAFLIPRPWLRAPAERSSVDTFWGPFLTGDPPIVIYSNTRFMGDSRTGLRYIPPGATPATEDVVDHYTGIGELASVYELTRLFDTHQATFVLKRSLLVTWDEAKLRNLVFIGSPAENPSLNALPSMTDFTMMTTAGFSGFVNRHPLTGEPAIYERPERPLTKDYAVIALEPGVESGKRTLIFSGLTTLGTQAAVEFTCHKDTVAELMKAVSDARGGMRPFEALIEVTLEGGVPLQSKLISVRVH
jgi:hypothetical protein